MRRFLTQMLLTVTLFVGAQDNTALIKHFEAYSKQMRVQGDVQGIINALTHLNVLSPSEARKDTLAYVYTTENKYIQALNTIGVDVKIDDSDLAVEVKATALKAINQPERALEHYKLLFKRQPDAGIAYEIAEISLQLQRLDEAQKSIDYGLANAKPDMKRAYYEKQVPYQVDLESGFMRLKAILVYQRDREKNIDAAIDILDDILKKAPNFNLVSITKNELMRQKQALQEADKK